MTTLRRFSLLTTLFIASLAVASPSLVRPITSQTVVLRVTTLAAKGPGSLRAALEDPRPRLVVFEVGGVIDLEGRTLVVRTPHLTLAGQTAPDPGITLIRGGLIVETSDVWIEHIAVRPGDGGWRMADGGSLTPDSASAIRPLPSAIREWAPDALGVRRGDAPVHDVVFDHCSATWAVDENLSTSGPADVDATANPDATAHDVVIRNCIIAEGLSHATHPKGEHSKGTLVHDGVRNVTIEGCLYAHNRERNPRVKGGATARVIGNVIYNWGSAAVGVGSMGNKKLLQGAEVVLEDNVAIPGPDTKNRALVKELDPGAKVTLRDNHRGDEVLERVLRNAGSRPARRDPIDARIVKSVTDRTGHIIDSQNEVGGYPVRAATKRALTIPSDLAGWLEGLGREVGGR